MKRSLVLVTVLAASSGLVALGIGCGGDTTNVPDGGQDGTVPNGDGGGGGDGGGDDGSMMEGGGGDGSMNDGGGNDGGGGGSNPGLVNCGPATLCDAGPPTCCDRSLMDGGHDFQCLPQGQCYPNGSRWTCDEPADCPNGARCCLNYWMGAISKACQGSMGVYCGMGSVAACKTSADCDGGACGTYTCGGVQIQACTMPMGCM